MFSSWSRLVSHISRATTFLDPVILYYLRAVSEGVADDVLRQRPVGSLPTVRDVSELIFT